MKMPCGVSVPAAYDVIGFLGEAKYTGVCEVRENGHIRLLTSGVLIVKNDVVLDAFLVGGGASGGQTASGNGGGGGSGYTLTRHSIRLLAGRRYAVTIGQGGTAANSTASDATGEDGGETIAFGWIAPGGHGGGPDSGGDGGSGGGDAGSSTYTGGVDGSDGLGPDGGTGQGRTTRAFGEADGELYASGGRGGYRTAFGGLPAPEDCTGDGGVGSCFYIDEVTLQTHYCTANNGASGVVIIRAAA